MAVLRLQVEQVGDVAVVRFAHCRTLDESTAQSVGQELTDLVDRAGHRKVLLDMSDVGFLTSTALGKLVVLHKKLRSVDGELKICGLQSPIESIFQITRLDRLFEIHRDESAALVAFAKR